MIRINHRQCRQAQGLLKWNSQDLAGHTKLGAKRIEAYERGILKLETFEIRELHEAFTEAGLVFTSTSVDFKKKPRAKMEEQHAPEAAAPPNGSAALPAPSPSAPAEAATSPTKP